MFSASSWLGWFIDTNIYVVGDEFDGWDLLCKMYRVLDDLMTLRSTAYDATYLTLTA